MDQKEQKKVEMDELNRLIDRGLTFKVNRKKSVRQPGLAGMFRKKKIIDEELTFTIQEPTLATLDRISAEGIMMDIDEKAIQAENGMSIAKKITHDHAIRMAKVVAIAVMGEEYEVAVVEHGRTKYIRDDRRLSELTQLFAHAIKPSILVNLCVAINTMSNLGDFMNCIRLTSANRTTIPDLIQE